MIKGEDDPVELDKGATKDLDLVTSGVTELESLLMVRPGVIDEMDGGKTVRSIPG